MDDESTSLLTSKSKLRLNCRRGQRQAPARHPPAGELQIVGPPASNHPLESAHLQAIFQPVGLPASLLSSVDTLPAPACAGLPFVHIDELAYGQLICRGCDRSPTPSYRNIHEWARACNRKLAHECSASSRFVEPRFQLVHVTSYRQPPLTNSGFHTTSLKGTGLLQLLFKTSGQSVVNLTGKLL